MTLAQLGVGAEVVVSSCSDCHLRALGLCPGVRVAVVGSHGRVMTVAVGCEYDGCKLGLERSVGEAVEVQYAHRLVHD